VRWPALGVALALLSSVCLAQPRPVPDPGRCGEVLALATRDGSTTRVAFVPPPNPGSRSITLVLLAGGPGHVSLDDNGCARQLKGNSLVRSIPLFNAAGFGTALVDAPSDFQGEDGLAGFRTDARHAQDLGKVIADVRARTQGSVWIVGTSRGAISAANAAARLTGPSAPDGVVLTSALMSGQSGARKAWVAQTVFDLPLENIRIPVLVVGHAADRCVRSPPAMMDRIAARTPAERKQVVTVSGGPAYDGPEGLAACEGRAPHGFAGQEAEVAAGIARFVRGGTY
jgi:pimeloyl-ACP methyl ester carboxylesterase